MTGLTLKRYAIGLAMLVFGLAVCSNSYAVITVHTEIVAGMQAPGTESGVTFSRIYINYINSSGDICFSAYLEGSGVDDTNDKGIWTDISGNLELVARTGSAVPGMDEGVYFTDLGFTGLNDDGQFIMNGSIAGGGLDDGYHWGCWLGGPESLEWILGSGEQAPDTESGVVYTSLYSNRQLENDGQVGLVISLDGDDVDYQNDRMVLSYMDGSLRKIAREGDPVPGMSSGVVFDSIYLSSPSQSIYNGDVLISATLRGVGVSDENNSAIFCDSGGSLSLITREGDQAPDMAPGIVLGNIDRAILGSQGVIGLRAELTGEGIDNTNDIALWSKKNGEMKLVAQTGDLIPGWGRLTDFIGFAVYDDGHSTFYGVVNDNWDGFWSDHSGSLELLVREGVHAPGTEPDVIFSNLGPVTEVTSSGLFAFRSSLDGPGVNSDNRYGVWVGDASGNLRLMMREGDTIDINDDPLVEDLRTIASYPLGLAPRAINDQGVLTFTAYFTDGTNGIFTLDLGLPGDLNGDGYVGMDDLDIVLNNWNQNVTLGDETLGDFSGDGYVGLNDLDAVLVYWDTGTPPSAEALPEPASVLLLGLTLPVVLRRSA